MQDRTCKNNAAQQAYEKKNSGSPSLLGQEADSPALVLAGLGPPSNRGDKMLQYGPAWLDNIPKGRDTVPIAVHSPRSGAFGVNPGVGTQPEEIIQAVLEKELERG